MTRSAFESNFSHFLYFFSYIYEEFGLELGLSQNLERSKTAFLPKAQKYLTSFPPTIHLK